MSETHGPPADSDTRPSAQGDYGELNRAIGARVADLLRASGHSQFDLARALGLDQAAISRRLTGRVGWRVVDVEAAAAFLRVPVADLVAPVAAAS